ncbi:uncharacterized protein LOC128256711 [Drosophila gunungcola]|uniref:uncharacterized protein LOC128256711 n=1 Tax=Drosophila gunungcola TaxID=103775 RepID=UPI0022E2A837|nr:uncharacterized protein LOC128256711 [Drosophila gunungcola]XP_052843199.1 uncharacterized protein LOC128256711 [Drosophila gunungcola]
MTSTSNVLTIGIKETIENFDRPSEFEKRIWIPETRKANFQKYFEEHLQKILLKGAKPLNSEPDVTAVKRFSASEIKKNGYKYEFGSKFKENGWLIDGPSFEPKGVLRRVKNRISKDHWINDNVAKYSKDSRGFIQTTVSNALDEEQIEIYQYLCYLKDSSSNK